MEHKEAGTSFSGLKTMQLNDQKAGMEGLDKDEINKIIYETSKGTPYFTFQEKRQKSIDSKVHQLQMDVGNISDVDRKKNLMKMDILCKKLESERILSHSIVHIDMDAFYAAVEMRDNPELKNKPMAVGSSSMLSTSNYYARKYGVRAAMPGFIAKKLCPDLIIVPCNFDKYRAVSHEIRKIVAEYDPHYSSASLDEVSLDLTQYIRNKHRKKLHEEYCLKNDISDAFDDEIASTESDCTDVFHDETANNGISAVIDDETADDDCTDDYAKCMRCVECISNQARDKMAYDIVAEIRQRILDVTQLTASAGIAPNTMLAKVCSDKNKPNGQYQILSTDDAVKYFISTLPVKRVSGIGPVQGQILNSIGILTCMDMWSKRDIVATLFSPNSVEFYMAVALGIGSTTIRSDYKRKSIGNERTFKEIHQTEDLHKKCKELCDDLIEDLKSHNMLGKVIVLKMKTTAFVTHTRNHSLQYYTADPEVIHKTAQKILDTEIAAAAPQPLKLRLMGIRMCNLEHEDSVSNNEKQHITLKSFLQYKTANAKSLSKSRETFTCPLCLKELKSTFSFFNDHVNDCKKNNNLNDEKTEDFTSNTSICEENGSCSNGIDSIITVAESLKYLCPVCGLNPGVSNLTELNIHIDKCLNKETIKEILAEDLQVTHKRKVLNAQKGSSKCIKISTKERRIDEYFR